MKGENQGEIKVFISSRNSKCGECHADLGKKAWIVLNGDDGAICLSCADLDHLVFLPAGDAALTRRSRKYSHLCAVVLKWSSSRNRYERQGLLIEEPALDRAEAECLEDHDRRESQRVRAAEKREVQDKKYVEAFRTKILEMFPQCPKSRSQRIAEHACLKYSGRVGRTAAAKDLDPKAVELAVVAHIRHTETGYDPLLAGGMDRHEARREIRGEVEAVLQKWRGIQ